jgi:signal transduction histidine kinase
MAARPERKNTEPELDFLDLSHALAEASPFPFALVAEAGHIVRYVNPAFCTLFGKRKDELVDKPFDNVLPGDECLSRLDQVYSTGEAAAHVETQLSAPHPTYWSYVMWPVLDPDRHPVAVMIQVTETARFRQQASEMNQQLLLGAVRQHELADVAGKLNDQLQFEIAERKRMESALLSSAKLAATARLADTMAHEINNPLAAITNLVYLLRPLQTTPGGQKYIAMLDEQIRGLSLIATQMLKFHRDSNLPTEFKLSNLLVEATDFLRPQAELQGILLSQRIETDGIILGYRGELVQVISNLLLNALSATPPGGRINVHLYPAPQWMCDIRGHCGYHLSVSDTGSGIAKEHLNRIFEPFFTTKGDKGTGLGLWLCTGIISRAGGSIRVRTSRRHGRSGTCFSVFLPVETASFSPRRRRYESAAPKSA